VVPAAAAVVVTVVGAAVAGAVAATKPTIYRPRPFFQRAGTFYLALSGPIRIASSRSAFIPATAFRVGLSARLFLL
jgi:hypothetical protein